MSLFNFFKWWKPKNKAETSMVDLVEEEEFESVKHIKFKRSFRVKEEVDSFKIPTKTDLETEDKRTTTQKVLDHLKSGKTITGRQCIELFDYDRLNAIVYKLKGRGFNVVDIKGNYLNGKGRNVACKIYRLED